MKYPPYSWLRLSEDIRQSPSRIWFQLNKLPSKNETCLVKVHIGATSSSYFNPYDAIANKNILLPRQERVLERFLKLAKATKNKSEFTLDHASFSSLLPYCSAIPFEVFGVGVISASLIFMQQMSKYVELKAENKDIHDQDEPQRGDLPKGVEVFRIMGPLFFGVATDLLDTLRTLGKLPKIIIIRMALVPYLDVSGAKELVNLIHDFHHKGTKVILSGLREQPKDILNNAGVRDGVNGVILTADYPAALKFASNLVEIK